MTSKRKFKMPTAAQVQGALPLVSMGLGILSAFPFNRRVTKGLANAAAVTRGEVPSNPTNTPVKQRLRETLDALQALPAETPKERVLELTTQALTLARVLVEEA